MELEGSRPSDLALEPEATKATHRTRTLARTLGSKYMNNTVCFFRPQVEKTGANWGCLEFQGGSVCVLN